MSVQVLAEVCAAIVGLVVGSFLTVVVHRVPLGESVVSPGSRCPSCGQAIRAFDNIPVLAYLVRRGRCRSCGVAIPIRYLLLELLTAGLFVLVTSRAPTLWVAPALCVAVAALVAASVIDLGHLRIPSAVLYGGAAVGFPLLLVASAGTGQWVPMLRAVVTAAVAFSTFFAIFLAVPKGMGFGDVRLAGFCGLFLGWLGYRVAAVGIVLAFVLGGVVAIGLVLTGRARRKTKLPFGPFLALGAVAAMLYGPHLAALWLGS